MFDVFAKLLSSIASFLFPLFASYKALKTSDPAQLTPWLMYWVVLACALLVESWTEWILVWIPFYAYIRLLFLLYLVLPQTQGARVIYQTRIHPWLADNEGAIEDFIASAHDRLRSAGVSYLKRAIDIVKTSVLGLPPAEPRAAAAAAPAQGGTPQSYTQALLARFSLPSARWTGGDGTGAGAAGAGDFYGLLASAVSAAAGVATSGGSGSGSGSARAAGSDAPAERISFIAAQREKLGVLLSALDREETQLRAEESTTRGGGGDSTPLGGAPLTKSRSEADFEKLEAESGEEGDMDEAGVRRRAPVTPGGGSWVPWGWVGSGGSGGSGGAGAGPEGGKSSGFET